MRESISNEPNLAHTNINLQQYITLPHDSSCISGFNSTISSNMNKLLVPNKK